MSNTQARPSLGLGPLFLSLLALGLFVASFVFAFIVPNVNYVLISAGLSLLGSLALFAGNFKFLTAKGGEGFGNLLVGVYIGFIFNTLSVISAVVIIFQSGDVFGGGIYFAALLVAVAANVFLYRGVRRSFDRTRS